MAKRKEEGEYSQVKSTVRNRERRNRANERELSVQRDQIATNTASSKFWSKKFKPASRIYVDAEQDPEKKKRIDDELRIQSDNVAAEKRFTQQLHWTQKGQKRDGLVREWPEKHTFFSQQDRLYSMDAPFMPPGFIASNAKVLIRLKPDGSLIEEQLENAEGDTEENYNDMPSMEEAIASLKAKTSPEAIKKANDAAWAQVQEVWQGVALSATEKFEDLQRYDWDAYIGLMSNTKYRELLTFVNPRFEAPKMSGEDSIDRKERADTLKYALDSSDAKWLNLIPIDTDSQLPVPPFSLLFRRRERVFLALLYQLQLAGKFQEAGVLLATKEGPVQLPEPFGAQEIDYRKFPYRILRNSDSETRLLGIYSTGEAPEDILPWLDLQNVGMELEDNDQERANDSKFEEDYEAQYDGNMSDAFYDEEEYCADALYKIDMTEPSEEVEKENEVLWGTALEDMDDDEDHSSDGSFDPENVVSTDDEAADDGLETLEEDDQMEIDSIFKPTRETKNKQGNAKTNTKQKGKQKGKQRGKKRLLLDLPTRPARKSTPIMINSDDEDAYGPSEAESDKGIQDTVEYDPASMIITALNADQPMEDADDEEVKPSNDGIAGDGLAHPTLQND